MSDQIAKKDMVAATADLFDEFRAQLVPEQGFNPTDFEKRLRNTLGTTGQEEFDAALKHLWYQCDQDPVLVYYLDNLKVKRPEVLEWLASVFHSESYDDPDLPTHRNAYWRAFYENSDSVEVVDQRKTTQE